MLTREEILANIKAKKNLTLESLEVPEWGGTVYVRTLTAGERDDFESSFVTKAATDDTPAVTTFEDVRAKLVVRCVVDSTGERFFTDDDVGQITQEAASVIDPIFSMAQALNGMSKKDVDALAKN